MIEEDYIFTKSLTILLSIDSLVLFCFNAINNKMTI